MMVFSKLVLDIAEAHQLLLAARVQEQFHRERLNKLLDHWSTSVPCTALLEDLLNEVARRAMVEKEEER